MTMDPADKLLTSAEVAKIFRVNQKTVVRWANEGRIPCIRTLGGHRRFYKYDIQERIERGNYVTEA